MLAMMWKRILKAREDGSLKGGGFANYLLLFWRRPIMV
jgi:hypothetical protein